MHGDLDPILGRIIAPTNLSIVECGYLRVTGWALAGGSRVSRIEITVEGRPAGTALLGLPRPNEAADDQTPQAPICGFEFELDLNDFTGPGQKIRLGATVWTSGGVAHHLPDVALRTHRAEPGEELQVVLGPEALPWAGHTEAGMGPRVAILVNDLLRAGSQLRLLEVLKNVVSMSRLTFTVFSPLDGPLRPELSALGVKVKICPAYGYESAEGYCHSAAQLATVLMQGGFAVVWASTQISFIGIEAARLAGIPSLYLLQQNQDVPIFWGGPLFRGEIDPRVYRRAPEVCALADRLVVVCNASRNTYRRYERHRSIAVIQNAIDIEAIERYRDGTSREEARRSLGIAGEETLVLCCGVIAPHKGQTILAQAFARVAARRPNLVLALVGDIGNNYAAGLKAYLERAGLGIQVRVLPLSDDVFRWYRAADVVVCPSQEEAQPSVVLETMAFSVPLACSAVGGVTEVVEDGVTGLLCRPGDVDEMADLLERALGLSPEARTSMAEAALARVRSNHDIRKASRRFQAILEELINLKSGRSGTTYLPLLSQQARSAFGAGTLDPVLAELAEISKSYERVGVDRALAIATDFAVRGMARELSILDVGCSVGTVSALLAEIGHRVTAIDNDVAVAKESWHDMAAVDAYRKELAGPNWQFVPCGLADHLESTDQRYDCALLLSVVHQWLGGWPFLGPAGYDPRALDELLRELCGRVEECLYIETVLPDEYGQMPYDPGGEFAFPGWFLNQGLATNVELVACTVADGGKPGRLYRVDMR